MAKDKRKGRHIKQDRLKDVRAQVKNVEVQQNPPPTTDDGSSTPTLPLTTSTRKAQVSPADAQASNDVRNPQPHAATSDAPSLNNTAITNEHPTPKVDKGKGPARQLPTNTPTETASTTAFATSPVSTFIPYAGPSSYMSNTKINSNTKTNTKNNPISISISRSPSPANPQTAHQTKQDYITSLRLTTEQSEAETARLQSVLDNKRAELQVLKDRLCVLTGGKNEEYLEQIEIVHRYVKARKRELRGEK